jgi:transmembrane sensor
VGTSFIVRRNRQGLEVTLLDGKVIVGHSGVTDRPGVALRPGERVRFGTGATPAIDRPVIDDVTAWRRGQLVFDATPIATAIAEMNRYSDRKIALRGNAAAGAKLSGMFEAGDSEGFTGTLAAIYGLRAVKTADAFTLESRRVEPAR